LRSLFVEGFELILQVAAAGIEISQERFHFLLMRRLARLEFLDEIIEFRELRYDPFCSFSIANDSSTFYSKVTAFDESSH